jgi:hypothetical protein|tara:strand:+ start:460 stop:636 length:177 start_codon:yes stop_codon:yes gene_type:complete
MIQLTVDRFSINDDELIQGTLLDRIKEEAEEIASTSSSDTTLKDLLFKSTKIGKLNND